MTSTVHFTPIVTEEVIITYGFYDAGYGEAGGIRTVIKVTRQYAPQRIGVGSIAPPESQEAQKPFSRFVLAAPHDNGMNSMQNSDAVLPGHRRVTWAIPRN
jgi:hypothetical protein